MGRGDGMKIPCEVEVNLVHRKHLRISATGRSSLHTETRTERRFAKRNNRLLSYFIQSQSKTDRYGSFADTVAKAVLDNNADLGVLVCGTGIGISIRANRHKGIRAALLYSDETAEMVKKHNNANIIVFGGRTMTKVDVAKRIDIFLNTEFEGGRHQKRIDLLDM